MRMTLVALVAILMLAGCGNVAKPTPAFARYTAAQVIAALTPQGIADVRDGQRGPNEPWPNVQATWQVFSYGGISVDKRGGQVLTYATAADLAAMDAYLDALPANLNTYRYQHGNALLYLSFQVSRGDAERLRQAFEALP